MKLFRKLKKGFTLIELVVVIAVIAVLSAVSVVSYVAITNKAKTSSDEQAVSQMNTILTANEVMDLKTINDVYDAFKENGLNAEDYKPLMKDRYFFWDEQANQIVYTDKDYQVLYPESLKGARKEGHQWYSLTQALKKVELGSGVKTVEEKEGKKEYTYAVSTPEQLYTAGQEMKDAMLSIPKNTTAEVNGYKIQSTDNVAYIVGDIVIDLKSDLDLMGGSFNFSVKGNFTLKGNGHKITGIVNNKDFFVGSSKTSEGTKQAERYGSGILGYIAGETTKKATALFENVKVENSVFGYSETKGAGLVGYASNANITFDRVTVENCDMTAFEHSCGGFVGDIQPGVTITLLGENKISGSNLKLIEGNDAAKECYGAGYFIGRQTSDTLVVDTTAGSFAQSGNTKTFANGSGKENPTDKAVSTYFYWDTAVSGTAFAK